jgi:transcriptional regulator with XRE-family HTH domain
MKIRSPLAQYIVDLRDRYGEKQTEFAKRLGVSQQTLARYEVRDVPKRPILQALLDLALKADHRSGAMAFRRALSGEAEESAVVRMSEAELMRMLAGVSEISGAWSYVELYLRYALTKAPDERIERFSRVIESGLKNLLDDLSKLPLPKQGEQV